MYDNFNLIFRWLDMYSKQIETRRQFTCFLTLRRANFSLNWDFFRRKRVFFTTNKNTFLRFPTIFSRKLFIYTNVSNKKWTNNVRLVYNSSQIDYFFTLKERSNELWYTKKTCKTSRLESRLFAFTDGNSVVLGKKIG